MKILSTLLLLATSIATAQNISFETNEGYVQGSINGQNGWYTSQYGDPNTPNEWLYIQNQIIINDFASDGNMSLHLQNEPMFPEQYTPIVGAYCPVHYIGDPVTTDVYFNFYYAASQNAEYAFTLVSDLPHDYKIAAQLYLTNNGFLKVPTIITYSESEGVDIEYATTDFELSPEQWYQIRIYIDFANNTISYYINNQQIYTAGTFTDTVNQISFLHDNNGGNAFIDNIHINDSNLSNKENLYSQLSIFPNPATNVINVVNNEVVKNVQIVDLNGRTVKSVKVNATEAQINISDLSAGVYMMNIATDKGTTTKKIVKQ